MKYLEFILSSAGFALIAHYGGLGVMVGVCVVTLAMRLSK